jgi:hypothetical protein
MVSRKCGFGPCTNAGGAIRCDIGAVDRAEWRGNGKAAGEGRIRPGSVAIGAQAQGGQVGAALDQRRIEGRGRTVRTRRHDGAPCRGQQDQCQHCQQASGVAQTASGPVSSGDGRHVQAILSANDKQAAMAARRE